jgi:hypothetical protein
MFSNNAEESESSGSAAHRTEVLSLCKRQLSLIVDSMSSLLWLIEEVTKLNAFGESTHITVHELLDQWHRVNIDLAIVHEVLRLV